MASNKVNWDNIFIIGDVHGNDAFLRNSIRVARKYDADALIQLGDFGIWPNHPGDLTKCWNFPIYFVDGNHEDHNYLDKFHDPVNALAPKLYHMRKGTVMECNGQNILCIGGAYSIDKASRKEGVSWFKQEEMTEDQFQDIMNLDIPIDVVFSHDAPISVSIVELGMFPPAHRNRERLQDILEKYRPKSWFFGHYHQLFMKHDYSMGTDFVGLGADVSWPREGCQFNLSTHQVIIRDID